MGYSEIDIANLVAIAERQIDAQRPGQSANTYQAQVNVDAANPTAPSTLHK
jgi:hypothetical protein